MSLVFNTNEVLTSNDLLLTYNIHNNSIENLIEKIGYSVQTNETNKDILISLFKNETLPINVDNIIRTNMVNNDELFKTIPMKIKLCIVNNEVYLFTKKNVYVISETVYDNIVANSYIKHISTCTDDELENTFGSCINNECYILFTSLYYLYNIGISYTDLTEIGIDKKSDLRYLHIEIPTIYLETVLNKISGYKVYFTNTHTRNDVWIPLDYFRDIFECDITNIKHNRVRDFIWYVRTMFKDSDMQNDKVVKQCYNFIYDRLSSEYTGLDVEQVYDDFPLLRELGDFKDVEITKLTIVGYLHELVISTNTEYELLNNILNKLKDNLK